MLTELMLHCQVTCSMTLEQCPFRGCDASQVRQACLQLPQQGTLRTATAAAPVQIHSGVKQRQPSSDAAGLAIPCDTAFLLTSAP